MSSKIKRIVPTGLRYLVVYSDLLTGELCAQEFEQSKAARECYQRFGLAVLIDRGMCAGTSVVMKRVKLAGKFHSGFVE